MVKDPLRLEDGYLRVPTGPGLGVTVDEQIIDKYRIA
jgi:L-alanine-DL-glutamate epimerase-like enolase superfamily enzyme